MALPELAALVWLPLVVPVALWAAWSDLARMKIPNKSVLALMVIYVVTGPFVLPLEQFGWQALHFVAILAVGFILSVTGLVGAGDAKFAAAMAPFVAGRDVTNLIAIFGICVVLGFVSHRLARLTPIRAATPGWESWERTRDFPMGYPLAATLICYLLLAAFWV